MKDFAIMLLAGPAFMLVLCLLGIPTGYYLGLVLACVVLGAVAIGLGVWLGKRTEATTAMLAVVFGVLPGVASAYGFSNVRALQTGRFTLGVALADLPRQLERDRLTLRDGVARVRDTELAVETVVSRGGPASVRMTSVVSCTAYPIVDAAWKIGEPVPAMRFGEMDQIDDAPLSTRVFHPAKPDELCQRAIDQVIARHRLSLAPDVVYLEALVSDSSDVRSNELQGPVFAAWLAVGWMLVSCYVGAGDAFGDWRRRRRTQAR